jgi:hypothetical protein
MLGALLSGGFAGSTGAPPVPAGSVFHRDSLSAVPNPWSPRCLVEPSMVAMAQLVLTRQSLANTLRRAATCPLAPSRPFLALARRLTFKDCEVDRLRDGELVEQPWHDALDGSQQDKDLAFSDGFPHGLAIGVPHAGGLGAGGRLRFPAVFPWPEPRAGRAG